MLTACDQQNGKKQIAIIVPQQNKMIDQVVEGFTQTLKETYPKSVEIKITNAQNNPNLESAIQQMRDKNVNIIVAIGTEATQKTLAITPAQAVISLASTLSDNERQKLNPCNIAIVHDEISPELLVKFIHTVYPALTNLTLIHSNAKLILPDVAKLISASKQYGIKVNALSINSKIPVTTQVVVILKDDLIIKNISTLSKITSQRHIPLISMDPVSVQEGANFGLGYADKEIGVEGAKLAVSILNNKPACYLPVVEINKLSVFINENAGAKIALDTARISDAAKKLNYSVIKK